MDAVERQVDAYNAGDLDAFVSCYADGVVIEDADGVLQLSGRVEMRKRYDEIFQGAPNRRAEISTRIRIGSYVVDEEWVRGLPGGRELHAVAIYRLDHDGLIDRVRFLR